MTESNPPAQPEKELRRRILLFLEEEDRRGVDHPHAIEIADALNETEKVILRHSRILECDGLVKLRWYIGGGALVELLPKGLLEVEKIAQATPETDSPSSSETSSQSQELEHSPDYASVTWRGQQYQFNKNQATCVRLLHEAWLEGTPYVLGHTLLSAIEGAVKMSGVFRRHPAWKRLILMGDRKATYRLNLSPQIRPTGAPNPPVKRP